MHVSLADRLPVCLCALFLPWGLQRPGVCPGAHHRARVWLLSTTWCIHQPQSSGSTASPASQLWHWTPCHWPTTKRLPDPFSIAGWEREGWQINVCECSTQWNVKWLLLFPLYSWADRNEARNILSPFLWPVGPVSVHLSSPLSLEEIRQRNPLVLPGGRYRPPDCEPRHHTAIVVPYRNRQSHLRALLYHLHPFLQRQQIHYSIYIVQQVRLCISECASCFIVIPPVSCSAWLSAAACLPSMSKSKALCSGIVVLVDQRCYWVKRLPADVKGVTVMVVYVLLQSIGLVILEYWAMVWLYLIYTTLLGALVQLLVNVNI